LTTAELGKRLSKPEQLSRTFFRKMTNIQKINVFRAPINLVHKQCGQVVDNHVNKQNLKPHNNNLYLMPIFLAVYFYWKNRHLQDN
jgi:hypothetical protein